MKIIKKATNGELNLTLVKSDSYDFYTNSEKTKTFKTEKSALSFFKKIVSQKKLFVFENI
jgi:hypothetical protein